MADVRPIDANAIPYTCGRIGKNYIDHMPTLDYAPVLHAHWIDKGDLYKIGIGGTLHECSHCHSHEYVDIGYSSPYCKMCGARMDEPTA